MRKLVIMLFMLIVFPFVLNAQTLTEIFEKVRESHPALIQAKREYEAQLLNSVKSRYIKDPELSLGYFMLPLESRLGPQQFRFDLNQSFPWFGKLKAIESVEQKRAELALEKYREVELKLWKEMRFIYYDLYKNEKDLQFTEESRNRISQLKELVEVRVGSGVVSAVDLLIIEAELLKLNTLISHIEVHQNALFEAWNLFIGEDSAKKLDFTQLDVENGMGRQMNVDLMNSPRLKPRLLEVQVRQSETELSEFTSKPNMSLGMSYFMLSERTDASPTYNGRDALILPRLSFSLPIFSAKNNSYKKEAEMRFDASVASADNIKREISIAIEKLISEEHKYEVELQLNQQLIDINERMIDLMRVEYEVGKRKLEDLIRQEATLVDLMKKREELRVLKQKSIAEMDYLSGQPYK